VVDVSLSGIGLVVGEDVEPGTELRVDFSLPGLDGKTLPVSLTAAVKSTRPATRTGDDLPSGYRLGLFTLEIDDSSRDNLVRYCYVVHPWERLRKSRLEVEERTPIPIGASSEVTDDEDSALVGRQTGPAPGLRQSADTPA
jgi:hypothetical protein